MDPGGQRWNLGQNFWFYDDLLLGWEPELSSPTTIVWRKIDNQRERPSINCRVADSKDRITLDSVAQGVYRVTLNYSSFGQGRYLLRFENNISYVADTEGFLSLPPGKNQQAVFPVFITEDFGNTFYSRFVGRGKAMHITSCVAERLVYENAEVLPVRQPEFWRTDKNWVRGIAKRWPGFFVKNTTENRDKFSIGNTVTFTNRARRTIQSVSENGRYLEIVVDGEILLADEVGLPDNFEVSR